MDWIILYKHIENKEKPYVDWRNPEKREEGFLRWLKWRMKWSDLDHYAINNTYRDTIKSPTRKPMTKEQAYWFSLIFGMTYQSEMAWTIYYNFPDFWSIDLDKLQKWNVDNMARQKYARDTKYNKGRITEQVQSLQKIIGPYSSIEKYFEEHMGYNEEDSFHSVFDSILKFHKYGRMTAWITCQLLHETCDLQIKPKTVMATHPSNWSVRSGLMYVYNHDNKIEAKVEDVTFSQSDIKMIEKNEIELYNKALEYLNDEFPIFSNYLLESHLCQYKKLMLGGDYAGHSSGDHVSRALWLKEKWEEVDFSSFFEDAIKKHHPLVRGKRECKPLRDFCMLTGQLINMHNDFDDLPNMYLEANINPDWMYEQEDHNKVKTAIEKYSNNENILEKFMECN